MADFFVKAPAITQFKGDPDFLLVTYVRQGRGIRVFRPKAVPERLYRGLTVYNPSVFENYCEQLSLTLQNPLDVVSQFLTDNGYGQLHFGHDDGRQAVWANCKEGLLTGSSRLNNLWVEYDSFTHRAQMNSAQTVTANQILNDFQERIVSLLNEDDFDEWGYNLITDVAAQITS